VTESPGYVAGKQAISLVVLACFYQGYALRAASGFADALPSVSWY